MSTKPIDIYSVYMNCQTLYKKVKYDNLHKRVYKARFDKIKSGTPFIYNKCVEIWNSVENSHFSIDDFKSYLLHNYLLEGKITWKDIVCEDVKKTVKMYDSNQFIIEKQTMLEISKELLEMKDINDYFYINENGQSLMYKLIINKYVKPVFHCKMLKYLEDTDYEEETLEHKKFRFLIKVISAELDII